MSKIEPLYTTPEAEVIKQRSLSLPLGKTQMRLQLIAMGMNYNLEIDPHQSNELETN